MADLRFAVTWDYRCPFARIAHDHVVTALRSGADWEVSFVPFSLSQVHADEDGPDVWDNPAKAADLLAMEAALVVRDRMPERFLDVHEAFFTARHDEGRDLRREEVVRDILREAGVDAEAVLLEVKDGWPRELFRREHRACEQSHDVWGVPTFIVGDHAAFVRLMTRPQGAAAQAVAAISRIVDTIGWADLNELKHTSLDR